MKIKHPGTRRSCNIVSVGVAMALGILLSIHDSALASPPAGYNLSWSDEFNQGVGHPPSAANWNYEIGDGCPGLCGFGNNELETYVSDTNHVRIIADPNATDGQALEITATPDPQLGYLSGRIRTDGKIVPFYGYIEGRYQLPYGQGVWPAFWSLGSDVNQVGWPSSGEMDIMESIGKEPTINHGSLHGPGYAGGNPLTAIYTLPSGQFKDRYHTFGLLWTQDFAAFYVDGVNYETRTPADANGNAWAFNHPFYLLTNLAIGGAFPGNPDSTSVFPQNLKADYIRVYTTPFNGPHNVPGVVQNEDYDNGGEGISYHSNVTFNQGGAYRGKDPTGLDTDGVSIETTNGGGFDVNSTAPGQWLKYAVQATATDTYTASFRVAAGGSGGSFHIEDTSGRNLTGPINVPATGGWQNWTTVTATIPLTVGTQIIKLVEDTGGYSLDSMSFEAAFNGPHTLPGAIQNEDYDQGGEGVAYHTTTTTNAGGAYRTDGVDVEVCSAGGFDVAGTAAGQWLKYSVLVQQTIQYVAFHVSSAGTGGTFHLEDEAGNNLTGPIIVSGTGGSQIWTVVSAPISLAPGTHVLKLLEDSGGYSIDAMQFATNPPTTSLEGMVTRTIDGQAVTGATVIVTSPSNQQYTAITSPSSTGSDGNPIDYSIGSLTPGTYTVSIVAPGFTVSPSNPATIVVPSTGTVRQNLALDAFHVYQAGLQMFSAPNDYGGLPAAGVLAGLGTSPLAVWQPVANAYALSPNPPADQLHPGRAYWARFTGPISLAGLANLVDVTKPYPIPVSQGWNMIGNPFPVNVNVSDLRSGNASTPLPAAQLISPTIYAFNTGTNSYVTVSASGTLNTFVGYWVFANFDGTLLVYPPTAPSGG